MRAFFILTLAILSLTFAAFAQPSVAAGGVLNAASFATGQPVAPGSFVSIFGSNLASTTASATSVPLSTSLPGVNLTVTFNNIAAPLNYVSGSQINAQLPYEVAGSTTAQLVVTSNGVASAPQIVQVASIAPGIFSTLGTGSGQAVAYGTDYLFAAASGSIPGLTTHPVKIGDTLVILATGLGPVNPPIATGAGDPTTLHYTTTNPVVMVGNVQANVTFSGIAPGFPAIYQINIVIPPGTPTGNAIPLQIQMGGITTSNQITIAVSN